jgi:hypothetical protein
MAFVFFALSPEVQLRIPTHCTYGSLKKLEVKRSANTPQRT